MRTFAIVWGSIIGLVLLALAAGAARDSGSAQAQVTKSPGVSQIYVQIESAKIEAIRTLATAQLLTAQWAHVQGRARR